MKKNTYTIILTGLVMVVSTACPPSAPAVALGEWSFAVSGVSPELGIILLPGGMTEDPPGGPASFAGDVVWSQNGAVFIMHQVNDIGEEFAYEGTVFAATYMEGTFAQTVGGTFSGTWTATFVG